MSFLLAIEGADGAGKATTAAAVTAALRAEGRRVEVISFPRYTATIGGHVLGDFLAGRLDRTATPRSLAVLYALDRLESADVIAETMARTDVIVFDRYIASNIAYQAAKVPDAEAPALIDWIVALETVQFALPRPTLSIYLDTPLDTARRQIAQKQQRDYTDRTYDEHEADVALQAAVRRRYAAMADAGTLSPWARVAPLDGDTMRPPADIAAQIVAAMATAAS